MRNQYVKLVEQQKMFDLVLSEGFENNLPLDESLITDVRNNSRKIAELITRFESGNESVDGFDISPEGVASITSQVKDLKKAVVAIKLIAQEIFTQMKNKEKNDAIIAVKISTKLVEKALIKSGTNENILRIIQGITVPQIERIADLVLAA